jgi:hypothetical protein
MTPALLAERSDADATSLADASLEQAEAPELFLDTECSFAV